MILKPPKLYLDTNHLINISKVRNNEPLPDGQSAETYKYIDDCIKSYCGLIFNQCSPFEWLEGAATLESAEKIAAIIDTAKLRYILESDQFIYTREILDECLRINPDLKIPRYPILQSLHDNQTFKSALGIIINEVPGYFTHSELGKLGNPGSFPIDIPVNPASLWAEEFFARCKGSPAKCRGRINAFNESLLEDIKGKEEYFENRNKYQLGWLKGYLKIDRILAINDRVDIDDTLNKLNYDNCPAVTLYWAVRENRMKSERVPEDNDVDDYAYLSAIPYANIAFIEKRLCNHIIETNNKLKSKVFCRAEDVAKALKG